MQINNGHCTHCRHSIYPQPISIHLGIFIFIYFHGNSHRHIHGICVGINQPIQPSAFCKVIFLDCFCCSIFLSSPFHIFFFSYFLRFASIRGIFSVVVVFHTYIRYVYTSVSLQRQYLFLIMNLNPKHILLRCYCCWLLGSTAKINNANVKKNEKKKPTHTHRTLKKEKNKTNRTMK